MSKFVPPTLPKVGDLSKDYDQWTDAQWMVYQLAEHQLRWILSFLGRCDPLKEEDREALCAMYLAFPPEHSRRMRETLNSIQGFISTVEMGMVGVDELEKFIKGE